MAGVGRRGLELSNAHFASIDPIVAQSQNAPLRRKYLQQSVIDTMRPFASLAPHRWTGTATSVLRLGHDHRVPFQFYCRGGALIRLARPRHLHPDKVDSSDKCRRFRGRRCLLAAREGPLRTRSDHLRPKPRSECTRMSLGRGRQQSVSVRETVCGQSSGSRSLLDQSDESRWNR